MVRLERSFQQLEIRWPRWMEMVPGYVVGTLGALVAADWQLPLPVVIGGAVLLGLVYGCVNGAGLAQSGALGMAGIASALFVVVALLAGPVVALRAAWARVVVRVAGSWIAAIGLLMLGWTVRMGGA